MKLCLVSRELAPFGGGDIGVYADDLARLLTDVGETTVLTTDRHRAAYEALARDAAADLDPRIRYVFVPEPSHVAGFASLPHAWSSAVLDALREHYGDDGPDVLEFPDHLGEGFVAIQARLAGEGMLARTLIAVRLHGTSELATVLDGVSPRDVASRATFEMERFALRHADVLLWAGGEILGTYERFYGGALASATRVRHPLRLRRPAPARAFRERLPVAYLYLDRLEARKGVLELVHALMRNPSDAWTLTVAGEDTRTAPMGVSMRDLLEVTTLGDRRITIREPVARAERADLIAEHDVLVVPSTWDGWPYVVLEAMLLNRPVLATRTGGLVEMVEEGVSGWLTGTSREAIADAADRLCEAPARISDAVAAGGPAARCEALTDPAAIRRSYEALGARPRRDFAPPGRFRRPPPLVSAIVPYKGMSAFVGETVESLLAQTHPALEIVIVCDGPLAPEDEILFELSALPSVRLLFRTNGGLGAARNAGIAQSRGRYVFPLDPDNAAEPELVERAVAMHERDRGLAYVTSWSTYVDEEGEPWALHGSSGYPALGNWAAVCEDENWAGDAAAVLPRRLFDLGFGYSERLGALEDWAFYRRLRRAGRYGAVIPERLLRYRVRDESMARAVGPEQMRRLEEETDAELVWSEMGWHRSG